VAAGTAAVRRDAEETEADSAETAITGALVAVAVVLVLVLVLLEVVLAAAVAAESVVVVVATGAAAAAGGTASGLSRGGHMAPAVAVVAATRTATLWGSVEAAWVGLLLVLVVVLCSAA
jgi:hypothetical protein